MPHTAALRLPCLAILATACTLSQANETDPSWRPLLGDTLDGWVAFTGVPHKSTTVPGFPRSDSDDCRQGTPVGLGDPLKIFQLVELDGERVLHVSGQGYAGLSTEEVFRDYHFACDFKWGEKKYPPRVNAKRDSGVLIHCTGEQGAFWNVWMRSLECQVQETDCGDFISLAGTSCTIPVDSTEGPKPTYQAGGEEVTVGPGSPRWGATRSKNHERDGWNRLDVFAVGDRVAFAVNGHVIMRLNNTKVGSQADGEPLTAGRIQLQSEAAECYYRRVRIRPLVAIPTDEVVPTSVLDGE